VDGLPNALMLLAVGLALLALARTLRRGVAVRRPTADVVDRARAA
jgi:hypothetical protein